ncbi:hypothetical protein QTP86_011780 [Hemibagrus guttatus]|nr:hypothetical protein QTP86_011780 [Hemibagrus guttatus]
MARMVLSVWLLSASITLPPLFGWAQNVNDDNQCLISQDFGYTIYSTAVAFYIPMSVMLVMYRRIYRAAKLSAAKHAISGFPRPSDRGDDDDDRNSRDDDSDCMTTAMKMHRLRGAKWNEAERKSASIFRREQKAAATLGVVLGAFTFCWLPFFVLSTLRPFVCGVRCSCVPLWIERTLLWLGYANSLINPFIYAFSNRDLRTAYRSLLACRYRNINRRLSAAGVHEALRLGPRSWHHPDHGTISVPAPSGSRHHLSTGTIQVTAPSQYRHHLGHSTILSWHHLGHGTIQKKKGQLSCQWATCSSRKTTTGNVLTWHWLRGLSGLLEQNPRVLLFRKIFTNHEKDLKLAQNMEKSMEKDFCVQDLRSALLTFFSNQYNLPCDDQF